MCPESRGLSYSEDSVLSVASQLSPTERINSIFRIQLA